MADLGLGPGSKILLVTAGLVIVVAGMRFAGPVLVPLLVAACIAAATTPIVHWLERRGLPTYAAVLVTILVVLAALVGFGAVIAIAASDFAESLPRLEWALARAKDQIAAWLAEHRVARLAPAVVAFDVGQIGTEILQDIVLGAPPLVSAFGVVFFVVIFMLLEAATFRDKLHRALGWRAARFGAVRSIVSEVQKYLLVKTGTSALTGLLAGAWCAIMDLPSAVLWGLLAFLLNFIPVFGGIVAAVPPVLAAFVRYGPGTALAVLVGYVVINTLIANLVEPKAMGRAAGLSPLVVIVSIVVWGWIFGPIGALLSVPLTMVAKIVLSHIEDTQWLAVLLGPGAGRDEAEYVAERRRTTLSGEPRQPAPPVVPRSRSAEAG